MKGFLVLGCEGFQENGFKFCNKVENIILDLEPLKGTDNYFNLIKYLDGVVKIFDGPCIKSHVVSNTIYKLFEMEYLTEKELKYFKHFYEMHRRCVLILELRPKEQHEPV